jgi:dipeptidyl aminopeptidase/acylaminoacyl peptidase
VKGSQAKPLLVSLHAWRENYQSEDVLAKKALDAGWNYIHPDFRGPNNNPEACLSDKVMQDIDDAISYMIDTATVDKDNIYVVGFSGGAYAALGAYIKTRHNIRVFSTWCPVSDLEAWYYEARKNSLSYSVDVLNITNSIDVFNKEEARRRSPLYWSVPKNSGEIKIYAGVDDGHGGGGVSIKHSLLFYNKLVRDLGGDALALINDGIMNSLLIDRRLNSENGYGDLGDRKIIYKNNYKNISVVIFQGTHEMLYDYAFMELQGVANSNIALP